MIQVSLPQSRGMRELAVAALALAFGLFCLPPLIYLAGGATLGRYAGGGIGGLFGRHFAALGGGAPSAWIITLGPYVCLILLRIALNRDGVLASPAARRDSLAGADNQNNNEEADAPRNAGH